MSDPIVETTGIRKTFGDVVALDGVDLSIPAGTVYGFVGPNGAGKTTTLRILAGLLRADEGTAVIDGKETIEREELADTLGFLPAKAPVYDELTGREQLRYAAQFRRLPTDGRIENELDRHGLLDAADRRIEGYSTGMRRKLGLAQATLHDPTVLLLDEPLNGLDPRATRTVKELVTNAGDRGRAVVVSSHDLGTVESICDRIGIIHEGAMVAEQRTGGLMESVPDATDLESVVLELTGA